VVFRGINAAASLKHRLAGRYQCRGLIEALHQRRRKLGATRSSHCRVLADARRARRNPGDNPLATAEFAMLGKQVLQRDDTPVPVLAPGVGKTKIGCLWVYMLDERPYDGKRSPAAAFFYSADRAGERPRAHLKDFTGVLHADGYAGFRGLYQGNRIVEAACRAHVRQKFFDVHATNGSEIPKEALDRIGARSTASKPRSPRHLTTVDDLQRFDSR